MQRRPPARRVPPGAGRAGPSQVLGRQDLRQQGDADPLTGDALAAVWSELTERRVSYAGDGLDAFEQQTRARMPGWAARDLRLMARGGFQRHGMATKPGDLDRLAALLGRPVRSHRDFARGTLDQGRGA